MERQAHNSLNEAALQVQLEEAWSNPPGPTKEGNPRKRVVRDLKRKLGLPVSWHGGVGGDEPEYDPTGASRDLHKSRQDRKSKEAQSAKKKELTRKKLYPKSGLKGEKKTFADKLFNHVEYDEVDSMVLEYFKNYFGDNLNEDTSDEDIMEAVYDLVDLTEAVCEAISSAEKLERSKYRQGEDEAKANKDYNNPKNPQRYKRRRKVTKARQEKETRKANKDYYNTTGTSDDAKERSKKLFRIRDMSSLRRGYQAHSWK